MSRATLLLLLGLGAGCESSPASEASPDVEVTFEQVYDEVFVPRGCTESKCHGGGSQSLDLREIDAAYEALLEPALLTLCELTERVVPGDPASSLLYVRSSRHLDTDSQCGSKMPVGTPGLTEKDDALLKAWIEGGARR